MFLYRRRRQPQFAVGLDQKWANRVTLCALPHSSFGYWDVRNNRAPTASNAPSLAATDQGLGAYPASATSAGIVYQSGAIAASSTAFSILVVARIAAEARQNTLLFYGDESVSPFAQHTFAANKAVDGVGGLSDTSGSLAFFSYNSGTACGAAASGVIDGKLKTFLYVNASTPKIWVGGKDATTLSYGAGSFQTSLYSSYIGQTNVAANNRGANGPILLAAVFNTLLSDADARALSDNAWQLFRPLKINVTSAVTAGPTVAFPFIGDMPASISGFGAEVAHTFVH